MAGQVFIASLLRRLPGGVHLLQARQLSPVFRLRPTLLDQLSDSHQTIHLALSR